MKKTGKIIIAIAAIALFMNSRTNNSLNSNGISSIGNAIFGNVSRVDSLSEFAEAFSSHADSLEETFVIQCTDELKKKLFQNCNVSGQTYMNQISANAGMTSYAYYDNPGNLRFVQCQYYEGKRIVHAWKNGTTDKLTSREQQTLNTALRISAGIYGSELEREKAVHDAICQRTWYYTDPSADRHECDSAVGVFLNGRADCDGYSDAFYLLGSLAGLEVRYQHGAASSGYGNGLYGIGWNGYGSHMWNLVRIGGKWVMTDVTWDDPDDQLCYTYFNIGTGTMAQDHVWETQTMFLPVEYTRF